MPFAGTRALQELWAQCKVTFAGVSHTHSAADVTSGTLPVARGGTGLSASPSTLTDLGSAGAADVMQASPRPGVTGTLPVSHGGTGATTASEAVTALGAAFSNGGAIYFYDTAPAEDDVPTKPALVCVTSTSSLYLVTE